MIKGIVNQTWPSNLGTLFFIEWMSKQQSYPSLHHKYEYILLPEWNLQMWLELARVLARGDTNHIYCLGGVLLDLYYGINW